MARVREEVGARILPSKHDVLHIGRGSAVSGTVAAALRPDNNLPVTLLETVLKRENDIVIFVHLIPPLNVDLKIRSTHLILMLLTTMRNGFTPFSVVVIRKRPFIQLCILLDVIHSFLGKIKYNIEVIKHSKTYS